MERICKVEGCERTATVRGYCGMHYKRVLRRGDPGPPGELFVRRFCRVNGCEKPIDAKELCHGHYQRLLRGNKEIDSPLRGSLESCAVANCSRAVHARALCAAHYKRLIAHGDPLEDVPIREVAGDGHINHGYRIVPVPPDQRRLSGGESKIAEHRLVMAMHLDRPLLPSEQVHHVNGVRTDNRIENLELWSTSHPSGQRKDDLLEWTMTILALYEIETDEERIERSES